MANKWPEIVVKWPFESQFHFKSEYRQLTAGPTYYDFVHTVFIIMSIILFVVRICNILLLFYSILPNFAE